MSATDAICWHLQREGPMTVSQLVEATWLPPATVRLALVAMTLGNPTSASRQPPFTPELVCDAEGRYSTLG